MPDNIKDTQVKYNDAERRITSIRNIIIAISIAWAILAVPLAKLFSYEVTEDVTESEEYQYLVGTFQTYVCYITEYGNCYHAKECGYLWNSSYKTTVYEAKEAGYQSCSKCTPTLKTTLALTETRYRDVAKTKIVVKEPVFLVWLCGTGCLIAVYFVLTIKPRKQRAEVSAEIRHREAQKAKAEAIEKAAQIQSNNRKVLESLGIENISIPENVSLLSDGTPTVGHVSRYKPYGNYTVYISPKGTRFHKSLRCCPSGVPAHLFDIPPNILPCKNCASGLQGKTVVPDWYAGLTSKTAPKKISSAPTVSSVPTFPDGHNAAGLKSSLLASAEYIDPVLYLTFKDGRKYAYYQVPQEIYQGLITAQSPGKYFHENIHNIYPFM